MKIYLDNILIGLPGTSLLQPNFTIRRKDEDGRPAVGFTGDLTFTGDEAKYIKAKLIDDPNAYNNIIELKFIDDCCNNQVFVFNIKPESLEWCDRTCDITAQAVEKTANQAQYACLKNTMIYDNRNNFQAGPFPKMSYCLEFRPAILQDSLIILIIIANLTILALSPILIVLGIIVSIINAIIDVLNTLPGVSIDKIDFDGDPSTNIFQEMWNFLNLLNSLAIGCGRKHPSPLVRDYINNVCTICGLTFQSSIYNNPTSPYYNTVYVNAPIIHGNLPTDGSNWIDKNKPLLNGSLFLDQICQPINGAWKIDNGVLKVERHDMFNGSIPWLDLTTLDEKRIVSICYQWTQKPRPSYGNFTYQKDAVNWVGAEANSRWSSIAEWNVPYSALQKDEFHPLIEFAPCRFRDDGIDRDVLSTYSGIPYFGSIISDYNNVMLMNNGTSYQPMLLIWDPNTGYDKSKVDPTSTYFPGYPGVGVNQFYNYAFWFDPGRPGNLYPNFWSIANPRSSSFKMLDFTVEIEFSCVELNAIDINSPIKLAGGLSRNIDTIEIQNENQKMIIKGQL